MRYLAAIIRHSHQGKTQCKPLYCDGDQVYIPKPASVHPGANAVRRLYWFLVPLQVVISWGGGRKTPTPTPLTPPHRLWRSQHGVDLSQSPLKVLSGFPRRAEDSVQIVWLTFSGLCKSRGLDLIGEVPGWTYKTNLLHTPIFLPFLTVPFDVPLPTFMPFNFFRPFSTFLYIVYNIRLIEVCFDFAISICQFTKLRSPHFVEATSSQLKTAQQLSTLWLDLCVGLFVMQEIINWLRIKIQS